MFNIIYCHSSEDMHHLPDESVHLVVTSPPYNVGKQYDSHNDLMPFDDYRQMLKRVWKECYRVLVEGGRIAVNCNDVYRNPAIPLQAYISVDMISMDLFDAGAYSMG